MTKTGIDEITKSVVAFSRRANINKNRAFGAWYAATISGLDEDEAIEAAGSDGGNDQGIDILYADDAAQEIVILQCYYPESLDKTTPKAKWDALVASLPFISQPNKIRNSGRQDIADDLEELLRQHPDYRLSAGLLSLGKSSEHIIRAQRALESSKQFPSIGTFLVFQEELEKTYSDLLDSEGGISKDNIAFTSEFFYDKGDYGEAWVGSVSASELLRLHKAYGDRLFSGNIRLYLGSRKGGINEQIIKTAKETPGTFWALNNGITIVADSVQPNSDGKSLAIQRFSIVNGCQTTSSLVRSGAPAKARVLARIISAKAGVKSDIVRFNNSQNAVRIWAVRAADEIQEKLRREFKEISINYAPKQAGSRQIHRDDVIQLDKVTQFLASADQEFLIQAINNKSELFDEPYQKLFKRGTATVERVYLAWLIGSYADDQRVGKVEKLKKSEPNVGLLGVASVYWIVHCTYKLLREFSDLESSHLTARRMATEGFRRAIVKVVDEAIDVYFDAAIDTYDASEYGTYKSTLRSARFLAKMDSKLNNRISRKKKKDLPDLVAICRAMPK